MALQVRKVIAKVSTGDVVTYHSRNIVTLFAFFKRKFGGVKWMNVYDMHTREQLPSRGYVFSEKNPPTVHV